MPLVHIYKLTSNGTMLFSKIWTIYLSDGAALMQLAVALSPNGLISHDKLSHQQCKLEHHNPLLYNALHYQEGDPR